MTNHKKRLVAVVSDLLFTVKIADAAKRSGMQAQFVKTDAEALAAAAETPQLIIVDLNCASCDPISLINALKNGENRVPVIGFVSHVEVDLKKKAQEAGADMVMARSAFSTNLPQILKRHAGSN